MTMLSFRVNEEQAAHAQRWAKALGIDRSELLRDALSQHLTRLAAENEGAVWGRHPLPREEALIAEIADWGLAEDWSDWADAAR